MIPRRDEVPCDYCGNDPEACICHLAPDFPDDLVDELDTDYLDWNHYEEDSDESSGQEDSSKADPDGPGLEGWDRHGG